MNEIKIYAACLASYNNGILHGRWIDATQGADGIRDEISEMLAASPIKNAEEWAIHDYDGFPSIFGEYPDIDRIAEIAEAIEKHGDAFMAFIYCFGDDAAVADFEDRYCGEYDSQDAFVTDLVDQLGYIEEMPEHLRFYFDYDAFARDLFMGGDYCEQNGHYFRNN